MKIEQILNTLRAEYTLKRTPSGWPLSAYATEAIDATIQDKKNYGAEAIVCRNCNLVVSALLVSEGCPNCGSVDVRSEITSADQFNREQGEIK